MQIQTRLSPIQQDTLRYAILALQHAQAMFHELQQADAIIDNCMLNMTEEQRVAVAWDNHLDHLHAQWNFRRADRKASIKRWQRLTKNNKSKKS